MGNIFVYADESGHSGTKIFDNNQQFYIQGALISINDIQEEIEPIINKYLKLYEINKLHGYELGEEKVSKITDEIIQVLENFNWEVHFTYIEKKLLLAIEFIRFFLHPFENQAIPYIFIENEYFRHSLLIEIHKILINHHKKNEIWTLILKNDIKSLLEFCKEILENNIIKSSNVSEFIIKGLKFAVDNPESFFDDMIKGKNAKKISSPNILGFQSLLNHITLFCEKNNESVNKIIHDKSDEFKGVMRKYHKELSGLYFNEDEFNTIKGIKKSKYTQGEFNLESSQNSNGLQLIDLIIWIFQRKFINPSFEVNIRLQEKMKAIIITEDNSKSLIIKNNYFYKRFKINPIELLKSKNWENTIDEAHINNFLKDLIIE
ncbi:DUF3800 domain-containing protein [Aliarcobacter cryaerophilus]|uniref:DUF3800 domain-containing protein n=2 Tax=unclassified Arcobacter TaxID=2593671 RepID=A0AA96CMJ9_9BACT|nr:DUF3800 domain-containing protein [Arcobacter sp. AZ-2023]WPD08838.1 DUF3800 domain-containing protein [Arcobacter sp. DSM 115954]WNL13668.1 DUF3800 domain-containing protein [Arcobacter sp. AZ-2023]WNL18324.1 DUF3800 domain-containing protein [Arcobacter sp. AZ-2023]WNL20459.1 DUF3800 domain-containing protein [Arcobacter sp. AZ-2023]